MATRKTQTTTTTEPGLQYPQVSGLVHPDVEVVIKNIFDNLFFIRHTVSPTSKSTTGAAAALAAFGGVQLLHGTLHPDTRPTNLTPADAYRVVFYATDKDHLLVWHGTGWMVMEYTAGTVCMRVAVPEYESAWVLCDGSGTALMTQVDGSLVEVAVPNMMLAYMRGNNTYSPIPVSATPPTISGGVGSLSGKPELTGAATVTIGNPSFTGSITGTVSGNLADHTHSFVNEDINTSGALLFGGGAWNVTGTVTGKCPTPFHTHGLSGVITTGLSTGNTSVSHTHGFPNADNNTSGALLFSGSAWHVTGTVTGKCPTSLHSHSLTTLVTSGSVTGDTNVSHIHGLSGVNATGLTTDTTDIDHGHDVDSFTVHVPTSGVSVGVNNGAAQNVEDATAFDSHTHSTGSFTTNGMDSNNPHDHPFSVNLTAFSTDTPSVSLSHHHTFSVDFSSLDTGSTAVTPGADLVSGAFNETNADHRHTYNLDSITTNSSTSTSHLHSYDIDLSLYITDGYSNIPGTDLGSGVFHETNADHRHTVNLGADVNRVTGGLHGAPITQNLNFTYNGNLAATNPVPDWHQSTLDVTAGTLSVSVTVVTAGDDGQPLHLNLLPYLRL